MKFRFLNTLLVLFFLNCSLKADDSIDSSLPKISQDISSSFDNEIERSKREFLNSIDTARKKTITALEYEKKKLARRGELESALLIGKKITQLENLSLHELLKNDLGKSLSTLLLPNLKVNIAGDSTGEVIGNFSVGQKISISYLSGKWGFAGSMGSRVSSPDDPGSRTTTEIVLPDGQTVQIPTSTRTNPFKYVVTKNGVHKMRMNDREHIGNPGAVVYSLTIIE